MSCVTIWKGSATMFECGLCPDGMIGDGLNCSYTNPCWSNPCKPPKSLCSPSILKVICQYLFEISSTYAEGTKKSDSFYPPATLKLFIMISFEYVDFWSLLLWTHHFWNSTTEIMLIFIQVILWSSKYAFITRVILFAWKCSYEQLNSSK